jgi:uncharacterized protein YdbL (DUF1318 family)
MNRWLTLKLAVLSMMLAACVTVNVYFPASAAEKAADRIIDQVYGAPSTPPAAGAEKGKEQSRLLESQAPRQLLAAAGSVLDFLLPRAEAQQPDINISTPAIRALIGSLESRHGSLEPYYGSGAVGLTDDGMIEVRDLNAVPLPERNAVRKLVADDNADRARLYAEIAKANGKPEWEADIRKTFAQRWIAKAKSGWYVKSGGGWKQK